MSSSDSRRWRRSGTAPSGRPPIGSFRRRRAPAAGIRRQWTAWRSTRRAHPRECESSGPEHDSIMCNSLYPQHVLLLGVVGGHVGGRILQQQRRLVTECHLGQRLDGLLVLVERQAASTGNHIDLWWANELQSVPDRIHSQICNIPYPMIGSSPSLWCSPIRVCASGCLRPHRNRSRVSIGLQPHTAMLRIVRVQSIYCTCGHINYEPNQNGNILNRTQEN